MIRLKKLNHLLLCFGKKVSPVYIWMEHGRIYRKFHTDGIRFIFLDIELETKGNTTKNMASSLAARVKSIISDKPYPYFIIFWTKNSDQIGEVIRYLTSGNIAPIGYIDFDKPSSCDDVDKIIENIDTKLKDLNSFSFLLDWEKVIMKSSDDFILDFFSIIKATGNKEVWDKELTSILGNLSCAYTGSKTLSDDFKENVKNASMMLSQSFLDNINVTIQKHTVDYNFDLSNRPLDIEKISLLNTKLYINNTPSSQPALGSVFIDEENENYRDALEQNIFKSGATPDETILCGMIITPSCDLALEKMLKKTKTDTKENKKNFRILYGLLFEIQTFEDLEGRLVSKIRANKFKKEILDYLESKEAPERIKKKVNDFRINDRLDAQFIVGPFLYKETGHKSVIIFHFDSLSARMWSSSDFPVFRFAIKEHLAFDIQSKMSSHANRLGNCMLS